MPKNWHPIHDEHGGQGPEGRAPRSAGSYTDRSPDAKAADELRAAMDESERDIRFVAEDPLRSLDDLIIPDEVKKRIEVTLGKLDHHDLIYNKWGLKKLDPYRRGTAINIYGPSGTGKSLCAEALAHRLKRPIIDVDYAAMESRYVGQTPKNIIRCFAAARKANAVLVFNEADSILGSRLSEVRQSADHGVNVSRAVMLRQLDRFDGLVVFTSNFPKNYDAAFVRRILDHIRFELPDLDTLRRLWSHMLPEELPRGTDLDVESLAQESLGLAGGDLVNVIILAAANAATRSLDGQHVQMADFRTHIAAARRARVEVGKSHPDIRLVSEETVPLSEVPGHEIAADGPPSLSPTT
ncbi:ATP-binding protein [Microbispora sp. ZYX-F-249]|uniref:ATP-binding protein n=1 Tax=Microbispora maris TaxID=3144104 RepID=A0ABV0ANZ7_9ACTN